MEAPSIPGEAAIDVWRTSGGLDAEACEDPYRRAASVQSVRALIHVKALPYLRGGATADGMPLLEHGDALSGASRNRAGCKTGESTADYRNIVAP
jgi:hypothetical protein